MGPASGCSRSNVSQEVLDHLGWYKIADIFAPATKLSEHNADLDTRVERGRETNGTPRGGSRTHDFVLSIDSWATTVARVDSCINLHAQQCRALDMVRDPTTAMQSAPRVTLSAVR
jgi:hypothetical protein